MLLLASRINNQGSIARSGRSSDSSREKQEGGEESGKHFVWWLLATV